jgi:trans-aconitate methyltransferase
VLLNRFLSVTRRFGALQSVSDRFWQGSDCTYLASNQYYAMREAALLEMLSGLPSVRSVIDVGCGDGRYTRLLAQRADSAVGFDLSPNLIRQARQAAALAAQPSVHFEVAAIQDLRGVRPASLVACMGVLSCLIDEARYRSALAILRDLVEPSGFLMLVDTLGESRAYTRAYRSGYVARYRRQADYERAVRDLGFSMVRKTVICPMSRGMVNSLYLFLRMPRSVGVSPEQDAPAHP